MVVVKIESSSDHIINMALVYEKITSNAKAPKLNHLGGYDIYIGENVIVPKNERITVNIGYKIKIPKGYFLVIKSSRESLQKGIQLDSYYETIPFQICIYNIGLRGQSLKSGTCIGMFFLLKYNTFPLQEKEIDMTDSKRPKPEHFPDNFMLWFKRKYQQNPTEVDELYLNDKIHADAVEVAAKKEGYKKGNSKDDDRIYQYALWKVLPDEVKDKAREDYKKERNQFLLEAHGPKTAEKIIKEIDTKKSPKEDKEKSPKEKKPSKEGGKKSPKEKKPSKEGGKKSPKEKKSPKKKEDDKGKREEIVSEDSDCSEEKDTPEFSEDEEEEPIITNKEKKMRRRRRN